MLGLQLTKRFRPTLSVLSATRDKEVSCHARSAIQHGSGLGLMGKSRR
jgi:hypothetical protein